MIDENVVNSEIKEREQKLLNVISKSNIDDPKELEKILKLATKTIDKSKYGVRHLPCDDERIRFGVISDLHIGHMNFREDVLDHAIKNFVKNKVKFVVNSGDTIEGMSGRDGHIYELAQIGASNQFDEFRKQFKKFEHAGLNVLSIEASNSHSGWYTSKANMGLDVGKEMELMSKSYNFLGYDEADIILSDNLKIRLNHPGGGTAYAVSYKMQKYVNAISGGYKPNIIVQGHYHKALYMFYRNVHCIDAGTLENQSPFMKKIGTPAHVGYWIIEFTRDENTITSFTPTFVPFYD